MINASVIGLHRLLPLALWLLRAAAWIGGGKATAWKSRPRKKIIRTDAPLAGREEKDEHRQRDEAGI